MQNWKKIIFSLLAALNARGQIKENFLLGLEKRVNESDLNKIRLIKYLAADFESYIQLKMQTGEIALLQSGEISIKLEIPDILRDFGLINNSQPGNTDGVLCMRTTNNTK